MKIIAEIKRGSPFRAKFKDVDHVERAKQYEALGAGAISVVTSPHWGGDLEMISDIRPHVTIPILCKDVVKKSSQIGFIKSAGADWILLIAALVGDSLWYFVFLADYFGLKSVIEVSSLKEVSDASRAQPDMILINNRSLATGKVDTSRVPYIYPEVPSRFKVIAASGYSTKEQIEGLRALGVDYALIGTHFMQSDNIEQTYKNLCD